MLKGQLNAEKVCCIFMIRKLFVIILHVALRASLMPYVHASEQSFFQLRLPVLKQLESPYIFVIFKYIITQSVCNYCVMPTK